MKMPAEAEIVVIGGGVFGTSAAFHLAKDGHRKILMIDRGPVASGTTPFAAGQTGYLNTMIGSSEGLPIARYSMEFFENFSGRTGHPVDFRQTGSLRVALTDQYKGELEQWANKAKDFDLPVEWPTDAEAKKMMPLLDTTQARGILFIPKDGYVEPKSVAVAFAAGARDLGVNIQTRTQALGLELERGEVCGVRTDRGVVRTRCVVVAAGAWTRQFCKIAGLSVKSVPIRHQSLITAPISGVATSQPIVRMVEPQLYVRPEKGGLLVGGYGMRQVSFDMSEDFPTQFSIPSLPADPIYYHRLWASATRFFPCLRDAVIIQEQRGLPTVTPDSKPIISKVPNLKGLILATGCQVGGIAISPAVGRMVADLIADKKGIVPLSGFAADRFGGDFEDDTQLRSACEEAYGRAYLQIR